jgi:hypothetical protein
VQISKCSKSGPSSVTASEDAGAATAKTAKKKPLLIRKPETTKKSTPGKTMNEHRTPSGRLSSRTLQAKSDPDNRRKGPKSTNERQFPRTHDTSARSSVEVVDECTTTGKNELLTT